MKRTLSHFEIVVRWMCVLAAAFAFARGVAAQEVNEVAAVGDVIAVTVYGEPDLNVQDAKVKRSGSISVPLIGEVRVAGLTEAQITARVTELFLDGYLKKPSVTVDVAKLYLYYIKGEIRKPGGYKLVEGLSVEKAIALAGGLTERASDSDVKLTRGGVKGGPQLVKDPTLIVLPGDVISVGESFF